MSAIKHTITDAEYEIMCILWRSKEKLTVADIIKELIPHIRAYLNEGGRFIISGIIKEREEEVHKFALDNGFKVEKLDSQGGWSAMLLK